MNDTTEAPTIDPTSGKLEEAPLVAVGAGPGTGAATSAMTAVIEAAAMRTAQAAFFISIVYELLFDERE